MKKAVLDTNFILSCVRNKIDFFYDIKFMGLKVVIPTEVIEEIENIVESKKKMKFREDAELALAVLKKNSFEKIPLNVRHVDKGLIDWANDDREIVVATLDREIKKKIRNPKLIIRNKKKLEII
jgi:hypothetical protein